MELNELLKLFGGKIRAARKTKKISQEKLAELSGLHPTYISNIEQGKVNASIYSFYAVANALNIPLTELLNLPASKYDKKIESEIAEVLYLVRNLERKKQVMFLSAAKGLVSGIEKA